MGECLSQRPRIASCLWMKFPQILGIFKLQAEDGVTGAFLLVLCGWPLPGPQASFGGQHKDISISDRLPLFRLGDVPVSSLFMRSIFSQELVVKSMGSRARPGHVSHPLCI